MTFICIFSLKNLTCNRIIVIICQELVLNRPVSASSNSLFKGLPCRLRLFGLKFNITFCVLLFFIRVTCRSQFDLCLLSFRSTGSTFSSSKMSSFLLRSRRLFLAVPKNLISIEMFRNFRFSLLCCWKVKHYWMLSYVVRIKLGHEDEDIKILWSSRPTLSDTASLPSRLESLSTYNFWINMYRH